MKSTDSFLVTYAAILFSTVVILSLLSVDSVDVYIALFAIEFFATSEFTSPLGPAESRRKTILGLLLLAIFTGIVVERIVEILV